MADRNKRLLEDAKERLRAVDPTKGDLKAASEYMVEVIESLQNRLDKLEGKEDQKTRTFTWTSEEGVVYYHWMFKIRLTGVPLTGLVKQAIEKGLSEAGAANITIEEV